MLTRLFCTSEIQHRVTKSYNHSKKKKKKTKTPRRTQYDKHTFKVCQMLPLYALWSNDYCNTELRDTHKGRSAETTALHILEIHK